MAVKQGADAGREEYRSGCADRLQVLKKRGLPEMKNGLARVRERSNV